MKKLLSLLIIFLLFFQSADSKKLRAYLWHTSFYSPTDGPYIETYLSIAANSINYLQTEDGKYQGKLEITMIFNQDAKVVDFAKYELTSPVVDDTANLESTFIDQQRFLLPNGAYNFEISIRDLYSDNKAFSYTQPINIAFPNDQITFSGIELVNSYQVSNGNNILSKSGYDLVPYVSNFYPENITDLIFYTEIYNTEKVLGKEGKFLVKYYLESFETGRTISNYQSARRDSSGIVKPILGKFNIAGLPSGNYKLVIEARDVENQVITSNKLFFQRSNPNIQFDLNDLAAMDVSGTFAAELINEDTLREYVRCLTPIATQMEQQFIFKQVETADITLLQQYFLNFWLKRDNINPQHSWLDYKEEVRKVNESYSTVVRKGYDTDRGRVYLKYGPPNVITESYDEPSAYPYEIWHYYVLGENQRNKKFVFYSLDMVTNDFMLLHSDAIGELSNYRWQVDLHRRDFDPNNLDITRPPDAWGNQADKFYRNPF